MRTLVIMICSFALAWVPAGAQAKNKSKKSKKHQAQSSQAAVPGGKAKKNKGAQHITTVGGHSAATKKTKGKTKVSQQFTSHQGGQGAYRNVKKTKKSKMATTSGAGFQTSTKKYKGKKYKAKHYNLSGKTRPATVKGVTFQQNRRIHGSQNWKGESYWAFRNYQPVWHERSWWNSHYNRVVFAYGGWYYWNAGWWYPAWGYAPNAYYAYDGPIYAYNDWSPDQVTANVQAALQEQGYYRGEVDGLLGPLTRAAIANYQRDHGLYITSAIDRPTLQSLGMA
jgi:hypothetical protein